jgi:L,D-transpeptidase YcbB
MRIMLRFLRHIHMKTSPLDSRGMRPFGLCLILLQAGAALALEGPSLRQVPRPLEERVSRSYAPPAAAPRVARPATGFTLPEPLASLSPIAPLSGDVASEGVRSGVKPEQSSHKRPFSKDTIRRRVVVESDPASHTGSLPDPQRVKPPVQPIDPPAEPVEASPPVEPFQPVRYPTLTLETLPKTLQAAENYARIASEGGWPSIPDRVSLKKGSRNEAVQILRRRLALSGDLDEAYAQGALFDARLREAVRRFQFRHNLAMSGDVNAATLRALNVPADVRARQLGFSARRLEGQGALISTRHVVVNLPSAQVEAVEDEKIVRLFTAVVGRRDRSSPVVSSRITAVNLNPTWTVPVSIAKKDLIPKIRRDPSYLLRSRMRLLDSRGMMVDPSDIDWQTLSAEEFTIRQEPGAQNALGHVRLDMPNPHAVYLHDTPAKALFRQEDRFHSSGCVRVENIRDLAVWLLEETATTEKTGTRPWPRARIDAGIATKTRLDIRLREPVPVSFLYLTGYADRDGMVHFRADVYGLDRETPRREAEQAQKRAERSLQNLQ